MAASMACMNSIATSGVNHVGIAAARIRRRGIGGMASAYGAGIARRNHGEAARK